ncbi:MAG: DDE-type integrase/transposase/recombinase [Nitrospirales bacterium]
MGDTWHIDEVFVTIQGERQYLWTAIDQEGDTIDIFVRPRRNQLATERFFRLLIKGQCGEPGWVVTDKLQTSDVAHRTNMPSVSHINQVYANKRAVVSHEPIQQWAHRMCGSSSST